MGDYNNDLNSTISQKLEKLKAARVNEVVDTESEESTEDSELEENGASTETDEEEVEGDEDEDALGDQGKSALVKERQRNKALKREASEAKKNYDELIKVLGAHLGIGEETKIEDSLSQAQTRAKQVELEKAVLLNPGVGAPDRLLRDKFFLDELYKLDDPSDTKAVKSLVKSFCDDYPYLKAVAKGSSILDTAGGQSRKKTEPKTKLERAREARLKAIGKTN